MHAERLERLAVLLEKDAANPNGAKFDLTSWASPTEAEHQGERYQYWAEQSDEIKVNCGTSACAMGLAALSGEFVKEGLSYTFLGVQGDYILLPVMHKDLYGDTRSGFEAATNLFDIDADDAMYLFDPDFYNSDNYKGAEAELFVAQRIRDFINGEIDLDHHPRHRYADDVDDDLEVDTED